MAGGGLSNLSTIDTGNGEDIITASGGIENYGTIDTGDGDDIITAGSHFGLSLIPVVVTT
jgi:hypothetical protein